MSTVTHSAEPAELRAELQAAGLRVTEPRIAVLSALAQRPHSTADSIFGAVRSSLPETSVQTVYGVLGALTGAGILRRIEPAGSPAMYERRVGDNHHHLVCTECRTVLDVDCAVGTTPCLTPSPDHGFEVEIAEVTFWGLCPACRAAAPDSSREATPSGP